MGKEAKEYNYSSFKCIRKLNKIPVHQMGKEAKGNMNNYSFIKRISELKKIITLPSNG